MEYWFRHKYNLSPKDPRYLECELWEIELEYEMDKYIEEAAKSLRNTCQNCGKIIIGNKCEYCGASTSTEKYYDPDFSDYMEKIEEEDGEVENLTWEEVPETN